MKCEISVGHTFVNVCALLLGSGQSSASLQGRASLCFEVNHQHKMLKFQAWTFYKIIVSFLKNLFVILSADSCQCVIRERDWAFKSLLNSAAHSQTKRKILCRNNTQQNAKKSLEHTGHYGKCGLILLMFSQLGKH